jgi:hypothetical protein
MAKEEQMTRPLGWLSSLSILVVATVAAQTQPDFTGQWALIRSDGAGADVARTLTVRQPIVRTNVYGAPMEPSFLRITIERQFANSTRADTYLIGARGGTVSGAIAGSGRSTSVFARWEDNRLVIDTGSFSEGVSTGRTEVWRYDAAGMLIVAVSERSSNADSRTTVATYRRNPRT